MRKVSPIAKIRGIRDLGQDAALRAPCSQNWRGSYRVQLAARALAR